MQVSVPEVAVEQRPGAQATGPRRRRRGTEGPLQMRHLSLRQSCDAGHGRALKETFGFCKGKPRESAGRKVNGLTGFSPMTAGLPDNP